MQEKQIGLVGLLETKVKAEKGSMIANNIFQGWNWHHNFTPHIRGKIWIAWRPRTYTVHVLSRSDQFIHCKVTQNNTMKNFFVTFVYGANKEAQIGSLREDLIHIAQEMDEAWCILGDFNAVLYPGDRMGELRCSSMR